MQDGTDQTDSLTLRLPDGSTVTATATADHPQSSHGIPVLVCSDGVVRADPRHLPPPLRLCKIIGG